MMAQLVPCEACGARLSPAASACPHCGHPRAPVAAAVAPPPATTLVEHSPPPLPQRARAELEAQAHDYRVQAMHAAQRIVEPRQSVMALLALACAVGGLLSVFVIMIGAVVPLGLGWYLGRLALAEIKASQGRLTGAQAARAAVTISAGSLALGAIVIVLVVIAGGLRGEGAGARLWLRLSRVRTPRSPQAQGQPARQPPSTARQRSAATRLARSRSSWSTSRGMSTAVPSTTPRTAASRPDSSATRS